MPNNNYSDKAQSSLVSYKNKISSLADKRMAIIQKFIKKMEAKKLNEIRRDLGKNI